MDLKGNNDNDTDNDIMIPVLAFIVMIIVCSFYLIYTNKKPVDSVDINKENSTIEISIDNKELKQYE